MNKFKFGTTLKYVLELFLVTSGFILAIKGAFLLLNLASTVGNLAGGIIALALLVSYVYYIVGFGKRVHNHLND